MDLLKHFMIISKNVEASSAFVIFDLKNEPKIESLSAKELEVYSKFTSRKRQHEFVAGRIACKKAFFKLTSENTKREVTIPKSISEKSRKEECAECKADCFEKFPSVSVLNTETGAPFIENSDFFVSVSHSHGMAIASVSNHAVGVDIEQINPKRIPALKKMSAEIYAEDSIGVHTKSQNAEELTALWTLKESLGKALRTGIVEDFRRYDTKNFRHENGLYRCDFENFPLFSGIAITNKKYVAAIVAPSANFATEHP